MHGAVETEHGLVIAVDRLQRDAQVVGPLHELLTVGGVAHRRGRDGDHPRRARTPGHGQEVAQRLDRTVDGVRSQVFGITEMACQAKWGSGILHYIQVLAFAEPEHDHAARVGADVDDGERPVVRLGVEHCVHAPMLPYIGGPVSSVDMPRRPIRLAAPADELHPTFAAIRSEIGVASTFATAVLAEADESAHTPRLPGADLTDVPFITLDPPDSMDLDQAFHLERLSGGGFRLRYAIADVAAFVGPGGSVDAEAHRRVETAYSPDERAPLYPPVLSEGAASLLPEGPRPAVVWQVDVDDQGATIGADVHRAMVSSRAKLAYEGAQVALDDGSADDMLGLLPEIGGALQHAERARGGTSLNVPTQEIVPGDDGYALSFRAPFPVEAWNAQLSLLTGRAAAAMMLEASVGIVRTMPAPDPRDVMRLRRVAAGLGLDWPPRSTYVELLQTIDPRRSTAEAVFLQEAAVLFRAASYAAFDGEPPIVPTHAAIASPYAHCTAPLRRLVDRYANEVCLAIAQGTDVPAWAADALPSLPGEMATGADRGHRLERSMIDAVEAAVLAPFVGRETDALVIDLWKRHRGEVVLRDPAVIGPCDDVHELGADIRVRLEEADLERRAIRFARVP